MSNSSSRKKALIKFSLHTLLVIGISGCVTAIATYWVSDQSASARNSLKQGLLAEIQSSSERQMAAITASEKKLTHHMQPFIDRVEALDNQVMSGIEEHQRLQDELNTLVSQVEGQTKSIQGLKKQLSALKRRPVNKTPIATTKKQSQPNVATTDLPFRLFDVQKRGLSYVAIIGPKQTNKVSGLMVLSAGHRYQGWRLDLVTHNGVQVSQGNTQLFLAPQGGV